MMSESQVLFLALLWLLATFPVAVIVGKILETDDDEDGDTR